MSFVSSGSHSCCYVSPKLSQSLFYCLKGCLDLLLFRAVNCFQIGELLVELNQWCIILFTERTYLTTKFQFILHHMFNFITFLGCLHDVVFSCSIVHCKHCCNCNCTF